MINDFVEVIHKYSWTFGQDNCHMGGLAGQVTCCKYKDVYFWTRENVRGIPSFNISADQRWGDKRGAIPSKYRQSLDLYVHPPGNWEEIAKVVRQWDTLKRPVFRNKLFNATWIRNNCGIIIIEE